MPGVYFILRAKQTQGCVKNGLSAHVATWQRPPMMRRLPLGRSIANECGFPGRGR
jgi:hypothetical protein